MNVVFSFGADMLPGANLYISLIDWPILGVFIVVMFGFPHVWCLSFFQLAGIVFFFWVCIVGD